MAGTQSGGAALRAARVWLGILTDTGARVTGLTGSQATYPPCPITP